MSTDIQILPMKEGKFNFTVLGESADSGLMLLQRVFTLLLGDGAYREFIANAGLLGFMEGGNYPQEGVMNSLLGLCCSNVMQALDASDQERISSLAGEFIDQKIVCTLTFTDGTTITGAIDV